MTALHGSRTCSGVLIDRKAKKDDQMSSIRSALSSFKSHLPSDWVPGDGLRALFPQGYSGSIRPLFAYVTFFGKQLTTIGYGDYEGQTFLTPECVANVWVAADGQGRWFLGWIYGEGWLNPAYARQVGFVFQYSFDGSARGYVDSSHPPVLTRSCNAGQDDVIAQHWPQMLMGNIHMLFQLGSNPDPSDVWTGAGFPASSFVSLVGANVPAEGEGSLGQACFHFHQAHRTPSILPPSRTRTCPTRSLAVVMTEAVLPSIHRTRRTTPTILIATCLAILAGNSPHVGRVP